MIAAVDERIPFVYARSMPNDRQTALRLPGEALRRAERLARVLRDRPEYQGLRVSTAAVLRLAMLRGLDEMEREHRGR